MNVRNSVKAAVAAAMTAASAVAVGPAFAGTASTQITVSASVTANCAVSTTTQLAFGAYDPAVVNAAGGADATGTGALSVTCTTGASTTIAIDAGGTPANGSTAAVPLRQMGDGNGDILAYFLYQNGSNTTVWGGAGATEAYTGTGTASAITVYGKIPKGQNVPVGSFSDTVNVTVTF